jgi:ferredoxin-type protein NapH
MRLQKTRRTLLFFSFLLFPITFSYMSPALAIGGTTERIISGGLLCWLVVLGSSVVVDRAFCSYGCPLGGLQQCLHLGLDRRLVKVRYLSAVKYLIWAAWVGLIAFFAVKAAGYLRIDIFYQNPGFPPYHLQAHIAFLVFVLVTALALGRRAFCHYLCFFSPLNLLGTKLSDFLRLPRLRVRVAERANCKECGRCGGGCPMTLDVPHMVARGSVDSAECITCGSCASVCETGALRYGFGLSAGKGGRWPRGPFECT